jgi:pyruvate dehydrogenase E1 component alpha subunit
MFRQMLRIRMVEEEIVARYAEQEMRCPTHMCIGQEAPPVAVSAHLSQTDMVFSGHRSHGHYLAKGGDLKAMIAELYGRVTGCARGKGGSQHLVDLSCGFMGSAPILASTISVAVGAAWGTVMSGHQNVVVSYFGDGATEEGAFHEALNFAALKTLPIVFVCENNLYSVHSGMGVRQPERPISDLGRGHGIASVTADGNDLDLVHQVSAEAVERARQGGGPTLLELMTYRWLEHCGTGEDGSLGYRAQSEITQWKEKDPIARTRARLERDGLLDDAAEGQIRVGFVDEIATAFDYARQSPFPDIREIGENLYGVRGALA